MPENTPQDHKKPADQAVYTFTVGGKTYGLPSAQEAAKRISGRHLRDATMNGDEGQLALGFATLELAGADPAAIDALYDLPATETLGHIQAWMAFKAEEQDASLGESSRSSS